MIIISNCPACDGDVEFEQWGEPFVCPHCSVLLEHEHECEEEDCYDYVREKKAAD